MVQHGAMLTMAYQSLYDLSNGTIFNDLQRPLPRFQGHSIFTLNISETVRYTDIVSMEY